LTVLESKVGTTLKLAKEGREVLLLEALSCLGGRIQTRDLAGFKAEFGPMRFEPAIQPLFRQLKKTLDFRLAKFSGLQAELPEWPQYSVANNEKTAAGDPLDSLELLKLGILRVLRRDPSRGAAHAAVLSDLKRPPRRRFGDRRCAGPKR
jgi:phytoene dehydrogenase-like protein